MTLMLLLLGFNHTKVNATAAATFPLVNLFEAFIRELPVHGGISALRLVRSVHSCAMLAKSVFVLKTKVSCPAAASGGFFWPKNWPSSEVGQKSQNLESSQNGLAYSGKS